MKPKEIERWPTTNKGSEGTDSYETRHTTKDGKAAFIVINVFRMWLQLICIENKGAMIKLHLTQVATNKKFHVSSF